VPLVCEEKVSEKGDAFNKEILHHGTQKPSDSSIWEFVRKVSSQALPPMQSLELQPALKMTAKDAHTQWTLGPLVSHSLSSSCS
jgi:hypothetical protein